MKIFYPWYIKLLLCSVHYCIDLESSRNFLGGVISDYKENVKALYIKNSL